LRENFMRRIVLVSDEALVLRAKLNGGTIMRNATLLVL